MGKKFAVWIGIFILAIMVLSSFGVIFYGGGSENAESYEYGDYTFYRGSDGLWYSRIDDNRVEFLYGPRELENVTIPKVSVLELRSYSKIYLSFNPKDSSALTADLILNRIGSFLSSQMVLACTKDIEECKELPLKDCSDAGGEIAVIVAEESDKFEVSNADGCLLFRGSREELSKVVEKLRMKFLDII